MRRRRHPFAFLPVAFIVLIAVIGAYVLFVSALVLRDVAIEAGQPLPAARAFLTRQAYRCEYAAGSGGIDTSVPGAYPLQISINKRKFNVTLTVKDTKAPTATPVDREIWIGETLEASQFVTGIQDTAGVSCTFKAQPDFARPGRQDVTVILTDAAGNRSEITASLNILSDVEAPVISGVVDQSVFVGDTISYKAGVTVTDNRDPDVRLEIDNSDVNPGEPGTYSVIYAATDASGNRTEVTATITFKVKPAGTIAEQELNDKIDQVFAEILKPGMSDLERISEIFYWIADHIDYNNATEKDDWIKAAYLGLTRGTGDCYTYYAAARTMLTRAGYECISLERAPGARETHHYWNLVKYNGQWYHFDPMPQLKYYHCVCLLLTDAEVAAYSEEFQPGFYTYIHDGIPPTATEPLDIERKKIYE